MRQRSCRCRCSSARLLLQRAFRDPTEPVSRLSVAEAIATATGAGTTVPGGAFVVGRPAPDPRALASVSEAWQALEAARLICPDLTQRSGGWFSLTEAGRRVRGSDDPVEELRRRLPGEA
ncbi:MAG: hypothetical protein ACJ760_01705 [Thermoleophilaceae bacterium]